MRKEHGSKDIARAGTTDGTFTEKIFQLTNELIPSVQRSRIKLHRGDKKNIDDMDKRRQVTFAQWGKA